METPFWRKKKSKNKTGKSKNKTKYAFYSLLLSWSCVAKKNNKTLFSSLDCVFFFWTKYKKENKNLVKWKKKKGVWKEEEGKILIFSRFVYVVIVENPHFLRSWIEWRKKGIFDHSSKNRKKDQQNLDFQIWFFTLRFVFFLSSKKSSKWFSPNITTTICAPNKFRGFHFIPTPKRPLNNYSVHRPSSEQHLPISRSDFYPIESLLQFQKKGRGIACSCCDKMLCSAC